MKFGVKAPRILGVLVLLLSVAAVGVAALVDDSEKVYSILEKAFYLSAEDTVWIRPGLNFTIQDVTIPADRRPVVTFKLTDDGNQPLDRLGQATPGVVSTTFLITYIPKDSEQYVSYRTRTQTSPITGASAIQATGEGGTGTGTYTPLGDGIYRYRCVTTLPADYDTTATHTVGMYGSRNLTEFGLTTYYDNENKNFRPDGGTVTKVRDIVRTEACNQCHDPLALHGGSRRLMENCILCHTPQTTDPDTFEKVDMPYMVHKIHMGANLPSGKPYIIIGNQQSVHDFSEVTYPQDIRNCQTCHKDYGQSQVNNWLLNPTRDNCGSCHDNINWKSGENHAAGAQPDDAYCSMCHWPESGREYDATVKGAHTVPYKSTQLKYPKWNLLSITNTAPGQAPVVKFKITDKNGAAMRPAMFGSGNGRLRLDLAGPNSDYRWYVQETVDTALYDEATGVATWTFKAVIPADAKGSYSVHMEGRLNTTINPGTTKQEVVEESPTNVNLPFAVTDKQAVARRTVVDQAKCNNCHEFLEGHGANRNQVATCVVCHNPTKTAAVPGSAAQSVDMKVMIHRIHTGMELESDYRVGSLNANEITYPGDRRNCLACHVTGTYMVPVPDTATPVTWPANFWTPVLPTSASCLGCHDSVEAAAHAFMNTAPFGEACGACHKETAEFAVSKIHAR